MRLVSGDTIEFDFKTRISISKPNVIVSFSKSEMDGYITQKMFELVKDYLEAHRVQ